MRVPRLGPILVGVGLAVLTVMASGAPSIRAQPEKSPSATAEEYPIYDRVVEAKFLTSETALVLIRRMTATTVGPSEVTFTRQFFDENHLFEGRLPAPLLTDFLLKARQPSKLDPRFHFGVRYRLVTEFEDTGPEETRGPALGRLQPSQLLGYTLMLEFSRVAFSPRADQALVYAGNYRPDGTGAGFLVWLIRQGETWDIVDTEVIWSATPTGAR